MGNISRMSNIERITDSIGKKIEKELQYLVGAQVTEMYNKEVSYHVKADIVLNKQGLYERSYEVHYRWATPEEEYSGEENGDTMESYFNSYLKGKTVDSISVGISDRDDELYLFAVLSNQFYLEIPVGWNAQFGEIYGIAEEVLTKEEIEALIYRH